MIEIKKSILLAFALLYILFIMAPTTNINKKIDYQKNYYNTDKIDSFSKISLINDQNTKIKITSTDIYTENISNVGWAWRYSDKLTSILNIGAKQPIIVKVKKDPLHNYTFTVLAIYYSTIKISGVTNANFTFVIFNVSYYAPQIQLDKVNPQVQLISWFNVTAKYSLYPKITHADLGWMGQHNISVVYSLEYRNAHPHAGLQNYYSIYERHLDTVNMIWSSNVSLTGYWGYVKSINMGVNYTSGGYSKYVVAFAIATEYIAHGSIIVVKYDGTFEAYDLGDLSNVWIWEFTEKNIIDGGVTTPIINGSKIISALTLKYWEGNSELYLITLDTSSGTFSGSSPNLLLSTEDYANQTGIYADFKEPSITIFQYNLTQEAILITFISYTALEKELTYIYTDYLGNVLSQIKFIENVYTPGKPYIFVLDKDLSKCMLTWLDSGLGAKEVAYIIGVWNSSNYDFDWTTKRYATFTNTMTLEYDYAFTIQKDIFIAHVSSSLAGEKDIFFNIGYNDSDKDGLGNWEEINVYQTNEFNDDTDFDGINDGAEVLTYGTSPVNNDTDSDHLTDKFELEMHESIINKYQTDPLNKDTDKDGLTDYEEIYGEFYNKTRQWGYQTNPLLNDTDNDGLSDYSEIIIGITYWINSTANSFTAYSNATLVDSDFDGIKDIDERDYETNPLSNDTDGDGLSDYDEIKFYHTNPRIKDCDGDGLDDNQEITIYSTDPFDNDTDNDGLTDFDEVKGIHGYVTNPLTSDSDKDGLTDGEEIALHTNPLKNDTDNDYLSDLKEIRLGTSPFNNDTDGDGLLDGSEVYGVNITGLGVRFTGPSSNDTDGDGLSDYDEAMNYLTDPTLADSDGDGLNDYQECVVTGSDPLKTDTDNDGLTDYDEFILGSDLFASDTDGDDLDDYTETLTGSDLLSNDTDSDGLLDGQEYVGMEIIGTGLIKTDPLDPDSDDDGLLDGEEVLVYNTNPVIKDTDGDGLTDYSEINLYNTDPTSGDSDEDGLSDYTEVLLVLSDPLSNDTDGDGLLDGDEYYGVNISGIGVRKTSPILNDTDGDEISDYDEAIKYKIDPTRSDTDGDLLSDNYELFVSYTSPTDTDSDDDGLTDFEEIMVFSTDALSPDTDGDGLNDFVEVKGLGTNPLRADTDFDGIPDNIDILFPNFKDEILAIAIILTALFAYAIRYGVFRSWRRDIIAVGLSDLGGTPMFVMPNEIAEKQDPNLISPALSGIHQLTSEISGVPQKTLVLSGKVTTIIRRGDITYIWVISKKSYPKLVKNINKLHDLVESKYRTLLSSWAGIIDQVKEVKDRIARIIFGKKEEYVTELEELEKLEPIGEIPEDMEIEDFSTE